MEWFSRLRRVKVFTDGSIRPELGRSGLAAIVRDESGQIRYWWSSCAGRMTCNEAEYAAVILAIESLHHLRILDVDLFSDSQVVVHQMSGLASAKAPALRQAQARLRELLVDFERVTFHHIPREQNRLADALANEAVDKGIGHNERT